MKIQFLLTQDLESPAGVGRYFPLAKALVRRGHSVLISALHPDYQHAAKKPFNLNGVMIHYVGQMHVHKHGNRKIYFNPVKLFFVVITGIIQLALAGIRETADVIHVCKSQPTNGIAAWVIHIVKKIPIYLLNICIMWKVFPGQK